MNKYIVRLEFSSAIEMEIEASTKVEAGRMAFSKHQSKFRSLGLADNEVEMTVKEVSWRECEDFAGILAYHGEPSYEYKNQPVWIMQENRGVILTSGELSGFAVSNEHKIFDVFYEGHYVDFGEDYYKAFFDHISEKELLNE